MIIDGKTIANEIIERLRGLPKPAKFFGAALVGDDPASLNFLKQKERVAHELGIDFRLHQLPLGITTDVLRAEIDGSPNRRRAARSSSSCRCRRRSVAIMF